MNIRKSIGARIRIVRAKLDLTQEQLAEKLGSTKSSISDYEIGDNIPKIETAINICTLGGVSLDWLLTGSETEHHQPDQAGITPEEERLLTAYRNMKRVNQQALLRIAEEIGK